MRLYSIFNLMNNRLPVLIDLDGVIRIGDEISPDAPEFLGYLEKKHIPFYIISNSTRNTGEDIRLILKNSGIDFNINAMTTVDATVSFIKSKNFRVSVYCYENVKASFEGFINDDNPDAVVIGDLGDGWSYDVLNEIFNKVRNGAEMIAMQKNKYWKPDGVKTCLDAGSFIAALEYASSKQAELIGKPSPHYFGTALKMLNRKHEDGFIMIGDDTETDIAGAQALGGTGILIYTGKTKFPLPAGHQIKPDFEVMNLKEVISKIS